MFDVKLQQQNFKSLIQWFVLRQCTPLSAALPYTTSKNTGKV